MPRRPSQPRKLPESYSHPEANSPRCPDVGTQGQFSKAKRTLSAPFEAGDHRQVAVKVIDDRGNELLVVKPLGR